MIAEFGSNDRAKGVAIMLTCLTKLGLRGVAIALLVLSAAGCQNKMYDENLALHRQNQELQDQLTAANEKLKTAPDPSQLSSMQSELAARDAKIQDLQNQLRQPPPNQPAEPAIAGIETSFDPQTGKMTVNVPGDVLFAPGQAELKSSAISTLDKIVAAIQKDYAGKRIFVEGHTDGDPIVRTKDRWLDNLDLSAARARTVAQYLAGRGIIPSLIGTRAFGATMPRGTKGQSRRVEIVVATRS
jgi:chemotaxis protein MotB